MDLDRSYILFARFVWLEFGLEGVVLFFIRLGEDFLLKRKKIILNIINNIKNIEYILWKKKNIYIFIIIYNKLYYNN